MCIALANQFSNPAALLLSLFVAGAGMSACQVLTTDTYVP